MRMNEHTPTDELSSKYTRNSREKKTRNITFRTEIGAGYTSVNWPQRLVTANLRTTSSVVSYSVVGAYNVFCAYSLLVVDEGALNVCLFLV